MCVRCVGVCVERFARVCDERQKLGPVETVQEVLAWVACSSPRKRLGLWGSGWGLG